MTTGPLGLIAVDLRSAMRQPGCPICRIRDEAEYKYLYFLLWENVNDGATRMRIIRSLGFCSPTRSRWPAAWRGSARRLSFKSREPSQRSRPYPKPISPWFDWLRIPICACPCPNASAFRFLEIRCRYWADTTFDSGWTCLCWSVRRDLTSMRWANNCIGESV
jgi:hypothetical protein